MCAFTVSILEEAASWNTASTVVVRPVARRDKVDTVMDDIYFTFLPAATSIHRSARSVSCCDKSTMSGKLNPLHVPNFVSGDVRRDDD